MLELNIYEDRLLYLYVDKLLTVKKNINHKQQYKSTILETLFCFAQFHFISLLLYIHYKTDCVYK